LGSRFGPRLAPRSGPFGSAARAPGDRQSLRGACQLPHLCPLAARDLFRVPGRAASGRTLVDKHDVHGAAGIRDFVVLSQRGHSAVHSGRAPPRPPPWAKCARAENRGAGLGPPRRAPAGARRSEAGELRAHVLGSWDASTAMPAFDSTRHRELGGQPVAVASAGTRAGPRRRSRRRGSGRRAGA
jgi:hypothetical protein